MIIISAFLLSFDLSYFSYITINVLFKNYYLNLWDGINNANYIEVEESATYAVEKYGDVLRIYFQGSHGKEDWKHNFQFPAKPYREMEHT